MPTLTFYPLGNADCYRIDLADGRKVLFDYADRRNPKDPNDRRIDLPTALRDDLRAAKRDSFDVVAFTHSDEDHVQGASAFFSLLHSKTYQGEGRIGIGELWVPAAFITESAQELCADAQVIQKEAQYRLLHDPTTIRVFSRPDTLRTWLEARGSSLTKCAGSFVDAGTLVPTFTKVWDGVEFFVHSPFASRQDDGTFIERNDCSLVMQATFVVDGEETRFLLSADMPHAVLTEIVDITQAHKRDDRLAWDVIKLPHHCSYLSLSDERGKDRTEPVTNAAWFFGEQARAGAIMVSTSKPIPMMDSETDTDPPHRQAANYYRKCAEAVGGEFIVTMEHPTKSGPEPLVITIDSGGATLQKRIARSGVSVVSRPSPRMG